MNARVNDSKFQLAAAVFTDALADPSKSRTEIRDAAMVVLGVLFDADQYADAQTMWHRLKIGLDAMEPQK